MRISVWLVASVALAGCSRAPAHWTPVRHELEGYEDQSMGFSMNQVRHENAAALEGELVWAGDNAGFELSPNEGSTNATTILGFLDEPVFRVVACAPGDDGRPDVGNHVTDCRDYMETAV